MSQISIGKFGRGFSSLGSRVPSRFSNTDGAVLAVLGAHGRSRNICRTPYGKVTARIHESDHDSDVIDTPEAHGGDCLPEHFKQALCRPPSAELGVGRPLEASGVLRLAFVCKQAFELFEGSSRSGCEARSSKLMRELSAAPACSAYTVLIDTDSPGWWRLLPGALTPLTSLPSRVRAQGCVRRPLS